MSTLPQQQKAIVAVKHGQPEEAIQYINNHPVPTLKPNEVLVKVSHSSVNPVDYKILLGRLAMVVRKSLPYVVGSDVSGQVVAVGSSVTRLKIGDSVYCDIGADVQGAYAQYVAISEVQLAIKPKNISYAESAAVPLATLTSYQALKRYGNLQSGQSVLIIGGSSGTGTAAIQLAKAFGAAHIYTVCSSKNVDLVKSLGADTVIPYDQQKWWESIKPDTLDVVYDCIGGAGVFENAKAVLKRHGIFVTVAGDRQGNPNKNDVVDIQTVLSLAGTVIGRKIGSLFGKRIAYHYIRLDPYTDKSRKELDHITQLIENNQFKPVVEKVYKYEEVVDMYQASMAGRTKGKLVIAINDLDNTATQ